MLRKMMLDGLSALGVNSRSLENPRVPITGASLASFFGGSQMTKSGASVGVHEALSYSPVWAAVSIIAEDIMRIPFYTYRTQKNQDNRLIREKAKEHPTWTILNQAIAPMGSPGRMTSDVWLQLMIGHALLHKGAYSRIYRESRNGNRPWRLEWIHSDRVSPVKEQGQLYFDVTYNPDYDEPGHAGVERVMEFEMFYINGLQLDDLGGLSLIEYARNSIGRQLSAEGFSDEFFANSGVPQGFFKTPLAMSDEAIKRFMRRMVALHGRGNRHKFGVLEDGMEWQASGTTPEDALLIEQLKFGIPECARWFKVPLHRLADPARQGYNTTEQENLAFVNSTLGSWLSRLEFQANDKLFTEAEKKGGKYYTSFDIKAYTKANTKDRTQWAKDGVLTGYLTRNEAREMEDLNPLEGLDEPLVPLNMMPEGEKVDAETEEPEEKPEDKPTKNDERQTVVLRDLLLRDVSRMAARLANAANRAALKPSSFLGFINDLELKHADVISESIAPSLATIREFRPVHGNITQSLIDCARDVMLAACECSAEELVESVEQAGNDFKTRVAKKVADSAIFGE